MSIRIRRLDTVDEAAVRRLAGILIECVDAGASVSFMHPLTAERAEAFWTLIARDVREGRRILLVAEDEGGALVGTVQVVLAMPENQPHRGDVAKLLVSPRVRRRGIAAALMTALEIEARSAGKSLLVLDTVTGGDAERLYARLGWTVSGTIPDYALFPRGGLCSTTVFYKSVGPR